MTRRSKNRAGAARRREDLAIKLAFSGIVLLMAPFFFGQSPVGRALQPLTPMALAMVAAGALLLWVNRSRTESRKPPSDVAGNAGSRTTSGSSSPVSAASDRVMDEAVRLSRETNARRIEPRPHPAAWGVAVFDAIEWRRFEAVMEAPFQQAGFATKSQSHGADGGVDLWLYPRNSPDAPVGLVQCKHWRGKRIGVEKVRELRGVMAAHDVPRGQFATTSTFTPEAESFARENEINLLDAQRLLGLIANRTREQQQALLDIALEGDYWRPTCARCGAKMTERRPREGRSAFWGCINFPRCRTTLPIRPASG